MTDNPIANLEQRLAKLEVANRRWRRLATASAITFASLGLMAAQKSNVMKADQIEAKQLIIRDAGGREIITLGTIDKKFTGMRVQSRETKANAMFYVGDHATLALSDQNGSSSVTLNSGTAEFPPDISMVRVGPGRQVQRLFRAP